MQWLQIEVVFYATHGSHHLTYLAELLKSTQGCRWAELFLGRSLHQSVPVTTSRLRWRSSHIVKKGPRYTCNIWQRAKIGSCFEPTAFPSTLPSGWPIPASHAPLPLWKLIQYSLCSWMQTASLSLKSLSMLAKSLHRSSQVCWQLDFFLSCNKTLGYCNWTLFRPVTHK